MCASTRPPKPSAKKRSPSPSQHAPHRSKKPKAHLSAVSQSNAELIEISDKEKEQEEDNNIDKEEDIEDNDAEKEEEPFKFKTTWKALCGKEQLSGIQSVYFIKGALFIIDIEL
jgi:hypothetical protein